MITSTRLIQNASDDVTGTALPERICRMREAFLDIKPSLSIHRARAITKITQENPDLPIILRRAIAFQHLCQTLPIYIGADELIVGHAGGKPRAAVLSPDICWQWIEKELDTVSTRAQNPYDLSESDKAELREDIIPFWKGKSIDELVYNELDAMGILPIAFESGIIDCEVKTTSGGGDLAPGYGNILLKKGFGGIKAHAEKRLATLSRDSNEEVSQYHFLTAVTRICEGMIQLGQRYADLARQEAEHAATPERREELLALAVICSHVSTHPPRNFWEALQAMWFGQVAIYLEETNAGTSPGRVDQYLYPWYCQDLDSGLLSTDEAKELFYCLLIKFNENTWPLSEFGSRYFAGYMPFQNMIVGGLTPDGRDGTNDLSYLVLDCARNLRMFQPSVSVRIHQNTDQKFLDAIMDLTAVGIGFPGIQNDEACIAMLQSRGVTLEEARDYCVMGCTEPHLSGKLVRWASATYVNFAIPIEFVLTNGRHLNTGKQLGLETGPLSDFDTFEKFETAVKVQLSHLYDLCTAITIVIEKAHRDFLPKPVGSALLEGCIESGKDQSQGGSRYHWGPGIIVVGLADYANSMAAVKQLVFDQKRVSLEQLATALACNFEGYPDLHRWCLNAPKYGNDDDYADKFAADIINFSGDAIAAQHGLQDNLELLTLSVSTNVPQGEVVGALPSGRKAGLPLADGISPAPGTDVLGPTAVIKSVDKINPVKTSGATLLNMKIDPSLLKSPADRKKFTALIRAHNQLGGSHIQFNCVSRETMLDAQAHPEQHRSLIVRVAGYSAYFTELSRQFQDEIINRTFQQHWE